MTFARRWLPLFCLPILIAAVAPRIGPGPHAATSPAAIQSPPAPTAAPPAYFLPPEKLAKALALSRIRNILDIAGSLWGLTVLWLVLDLRIASGLESWARRRAPWHWLQGLIFFIVLVLILRLASLPLEAYGHLIARSYGIGVQGWPGWFGDRAKSLGLALLFGAPVLQLFNRIVRRWPRRFWLRVWIATLPLMALGAFAGPLLAPIYDQYEPLALHHPALVAELEKVVARTGTSIPPERMFLMKASAKSNGLNAYVAGLGATKRYVMWDTATDRLPTDEILFLFGHESGHYVLNHIPKGLALTAAASLVVFWACAGFAAWLVRRFGVRWRIQEERFGVKVTQPDEIAKLSSRAGFVVLLFTVSAASFLLEPASNAVSRHIEHEADVYGQEAIHGLVPDPQKTAVAAFNALGEAWLEDPSPSPFIEFWLYDHPSVQTRATFAAHYDPWAKGGHGSFFAK